jgi:DNA-binding NtrC family response regulator
MMMCEASPTGRRDGDDTVAATIPLHEAICAFKRRLVEQALAAAGGNRSRAAAALGIERTSLLRLIRELGINGLPVGQRGRPPVSRKP